MSDQIQKIALVTGAGTGVGRASAVALAHAGYTVVITGRRVEKLEQTVQAAGPGETIVAFGCDGSEAGSGTEVFDMFTPRFGRREVLV